MKGKTSCVSVVMLLGVMACGDDTLTDHDPWDLWEAWPTSENNAPCEVKRIHYRDEDGDGYGVDDPATNMESCSAVLPEGYSIYAGDCQDSEPRRSPGLEETCDALDNDCSGTVNDKIICDFFAHTRDALYRIDPFQPKMTRVGQTPALFDLDTHPDGTLWGVGPLGLYAFEESSNTWSDPLPMSASGNGMAIHSGGDAYLSHGEYVQRVHLDTGAVLDTIEPGPGYTSSGDIAFDDLGVMYLSSADPNGERPEDTLWSYDVITGEAKEIGNTGFSGIYALTFAWDALYGLTAGGDLLLLDRETGEASKITTFEGQSWFGAASTSRVRMRR